MGQIIRKTNAKGDFVGWYARWYEGGVRKTKATKATSAAEARRILAEIEARIGRGKLGVPDLAQQLTADEILRRYVDEADAHTRDRDRWARRIRYEIKSLLPLLRRILTNDAAKRIVRHLSSIHKPNTAAKKLATLKAAFRWAVRHGLASLNPFEGTKPPRVDETVEYLAVAEIKALIAAADARRDMRGSMLPIAVRLGVYAGLRCGEVFGLRWRDIDFDRGVLIVRHSYRGAPTKSGKHRAVPIAEDLAVALRLWRERCPQTDAGVVCPVLGLDGRWIPAQNRPCLKHTYRLAGLAIPKAPWHVLRHSFASQYLMHGGSLIALQKMLGHSSLKMTSVYSHLSSEHLQSEILRLKF